MNFDQILFFISNFYLIKGNTGITFVLDTILNFIIADCYIIRVKFIDINTIT